MPRPFMQSFENTLISHEVPSAKWCLALLHCVRDVQPVATFVKDKLIAAKLDWPEAKRQFYLAFSPVTSEEAQRVELAKAQQNANEPIASYLARYQSLLKGLDVHDEDQQALTAFHLSLIPGINAKLHDTIATSAAVAHANSEEVKPRTLSFTFTLLGHLAPQLAQFNTSISNRGRSSSASAVSYSAPPSSSAPPPVTFSLPAPTGIQFCRYCKSLDHNISSCPKATKKPWMSSAKPITPSVAQPAFPASVKPDSPKTVRPICSHCKSKGHHADKCYILHPHLRPARPAQVSASRAVVQSVPTPIASADMITDLETPHAIVRRAAVEKSKLIYLPLLLNDIKQPSLFDTACTQSLVDSKWAAEHKLVIHPATGSISQVASNSSTPIVGYVLLNVQCAENILLQRRFWVAGTEDSVILGIDLISEFRLLKDLQPNTQFHVSMSNLYLYLLRR